jgi:hypothetical protein
MVSATACLREAMRAGLSPGWLLTASITLRQISFIEGM